MEIGRKGAERPLRSLCPFAPRSPTSLYLIRLYPQSMHMTCYHCIVKLRKKEKSLTTQQPQPLEATQLGEQYHLGSLLETYHVYYGRASIRFYQIQLAISTVVIIVSAVSLVDLLVFKSLVPIYYLPIMAFAINVPIFYHNIHNWRNKTLPPVPFNPWQRRLRVYVYENGFVRLRATKPQVIRWGEVKYVEYVGLVSYDWYGIQPIVKAWLTNGKVIKFARNIVGVTELCTTMRREQVKSNEGQRKG